MNIENINLNDISQILSSLDESEIESLKSVAQSFFPIGQQEEEKSKEKKEEQPPESESAVPPIDFESMKKISAILSMLNKRVDDPRCDLLRALKPMLKNERRQRVDEAVKMLELMSILPKLKEL